MGLFDKFKKQEKTHDVFQQDLSHKESPGSVFVIHLLMREKCDMPNKEIMTSVMQKHLGDVECFCHNKDICGFAVKKHKLEFEEGLMPVQLMITGCTDREEHKIDEFTKSQMWDCMEDRDRILAECKYQVSAMDMLARGMEYKERGDMLMDYMEALVEMYPQCEAILFQTSGKMFTAAQIREHKIQRESRFIYFAVNVRFFNIEGTNDMMVDTIGMSTLYLPDLQYHFHGIDQNWIVNHAYNLLSYIYDNNNPIESGETVDGITAGKMDRNVQWKCHYEDAMIQPSRGVLDIYMNEYASGGRDY
ncbi:MULTISPECIES: DUF4261 domain-containing protein [Clostridium]|uniref:DUF4261 domain-containing protein n=1 Tax=Clostridium cibarium TaxID=2762247 RepID=A0ABR8PWE2_9CLOT|nr:MULTISPECIES: DUF4261 domain-containing protein [Clostridium]MBD7912506.1 DUF4261 domain-containing protein [Clostridium cibarium]